MKSSQWIAWAVVGVLVLLAWRRVSQVIPHIAPSKIADPADLSAIGSPAPLSDAPLAPANLEMDSVLNLVFPN